VELLNKEVITQSFLYFVMSVSILAIADEPTKNNAQSPPSTTETAPTKGESASSSTTEPPTDVGEKPVDLSLREPTVEEVSVEKKKDQTFLEYLATTKRLTGDWGGVRKNLEDVGIQIKIKVLNEFMVNMHGGLDTENGSDFGGSYDIDFIFDFEKMKLIKGASFQIRAKGTWGGDDNDFDKQKIGGLFKTNQDAGNEEVIFVDKWWYQQELFDGILEFHLGRLDIMKDLVDLSTIMGNENEQFLNQALVRNATIPSAKALGVYGRLNLPAEFYVFVIVSDAETRERRTNFDTAFHDDAAPRVYLETGWEPAFATAKGDMKGHYRVGTWYDGLVKDIYFDDLDGRRAPRTQHGDWGFYIGVDQMIWKEQEKPDDSQGVSVAVRYGYAHGDVNRIEHFWAAAVQYEGIIPERNKDVLGFGVGQAIQSDEFRIVRPLADRETVYELYYSIQVAPWLIVSPDFQYITNAGGDKDDRNAMVAGLRVTISL